jgi:pyruvate kinase
MPALTKNHTKFITTLGPASMNYEVMKGLAAAGADIFRANFVHMKYEKYHEVQAWLKEINQELGTNVVIQADIQGPSIRMGTLSENGYFLQEGQEYTFITGKANCEGMGERELPINDETIHQFIESGQHITFMNGSLEGMVTAKDGQRLTVKMINSGTLKSHKSINLPETELSSCLTEKDKKDLAFLMEAGVDWVAISFVSKASQIEEVRQIIGDRPTKITSKIERRSAVANLEEIVKASDAVMVARGDLGIELPMEEVPIIQNEIIGVCHRLHKPVIVATQMMLSMTQSLRPTRAEVSDVANAVFSRADAVMMSEETAEGINPVNALETMVKVARRAEEHIYNEPNFFDTL